MRSTSFRLAMVIAAAFELSLLVAPNVAEAAEGQRHATDIRVNAVAPGVVDTPLHRDRSKDVMESMSPMGRPSTVKDITDAVMYLTEAATVTGDILYVDGGFNTTAMGNIEE